MTGAGEPREAIPPTVELGSHDRSGSAGRPAPAAPRRGEQIDRFVVLDTLGHGGMGVVVAAYDPKLDRKVALKLLRRDLAPADGGTEARARLLREAQAMAKLRHPNVITVFEVGEVQGQVFLAMEHVAGGTLSAWSARRRAEPGGWRAILAAFVQAGRGLQAAHAEGLVHRDFKPANVLVEGDRFQVSDFGIASVDGQPSPTSDPRAEPPAGVLTGTGHVIGTAPYIAPELFEGRAADARSDQYAFCVALFESLYGVRPIAGETLGAVRDALARGEIRTPADDHGVPDWVRQAVLRGLRPDPSARWPAMAELLRTLDSPDEAEVERRTRVAVAVAIGSMFVVVPWIAKSLGSPFDRSSYAGAIGQTCALLALLFGLAAWRRDAVTATALNRKAFGAVVAVLTMQLPLELTNAALGVSVHASDIQHLTLWGAMAAMFAVTTDRRFAVLAGMYLGWIPAALAWPQHHVAILGLSNAGFVVFVASVWRRASPRDGATSSPSDRRPPSPAPPPPDR